METEVSTETLRNFIANRFNGRMAVLDATFATLKSTNFRAATVAQLGVIRSRLMTALEADSDGNVGVGRYCDVKLASYLELMKDN